MKRVCLFLCLVAFAVFAAEPSRCCFDFGSGALAKGCLPVLPATVYGAGQDYGFDLKRPVILKAHDDFISSSESFFFSAALPEGSYRVKVSLAGAWDGSIVTIRSESRRLMLENVPVPAGKISEVTFMVNVRTTAIDGGGNVKLKEREIPYLHWDEKLTLEFSGTSIRVAALEIAPVPDLPVLYIAGDSTVCDQPGEPYNSWGQMLPRFFSPEIVVANHAMSGETIRSSLGALRFDKIFSTMNAGDYLLIQYGHNDMKNKAPDAIGIYRNDLADLISETRKRGATPVLITSMERKKGMNSPTLRGYPDAVRNVAHLQGAALINLNAMSKVLYKALGSDLGQAFVDGTHHTPYGSYQLAQCVVEGIRQSDLELARFIVADLPRFDPGKPDSVDCFSIPPSLTRDPRKPLGN